jgi:hypothetical protein
MGETKAAHSSAGGNGRVSVCCMNSDRNFHLHRTDHSAPLARKLSLNIAQTDSPVSPRDSMFPSPRARQTSTSQISSPAGAEPNPWGPRRVFSESLAKRLTGNNSDEENGTSGLNNAPPNPNSELPDPAPIPSVLPETAPQIDAPIHFDPAIGPVQDHPVANVGTVLNGNIVEQPPPGLMSVDPSVVQWTYIDPSGKVQGKLPVSLLTSRMLIITY